MESFNGEFREESLNAYWFESLDDLMLVRGAIMAAITIQTIAPERKRPSSSTAPTNPLIPTRNLAQEAEPPVSSGLIYVHASTACVTAICTCRADSMCRQPSSGLCNKTCLSNQFAGAGTTASPRRYRRAGMTQRDRCLRTVRLGPERAVDREAERTAPRYSVDALKSIAPVGHRHINFRGTYRFSIDRYAERLAPTVA